MLISLTTSHEEIFFEKPGEQRPITVRGIFDNGSRLDITDSTRTTYTSNDTTVATVGSIGHVTSVGPGNTSIIVSYGVKSLTVPVAVSEK